MIRASVIQNKLDRLEVLSVSCIVDLYVQMSDGAVNPLTRRLNTAFNHFFSCILLFSLDYIIIIVVVIIINILLL